MARNAAKRLVRTNPPAHEMKCKVALVTNAFPTLSETFIVSHFLGLLNRGLDVCVVCWHSEKSEWQKFPQLNGQPGIAARVRTIWPHCSKLLAGVLAPFALLYCLANNPLATWRYLQRGYARFGL